MSMTKKDFEALADELRAGVVAGSIGNATLTPVIRFLRAQNPQFSERLWTEYLMEGRKPAKAKKQSAPKVVVTIRGGSVRDVTTLGGVVEVEIRDYDKCPECGGVECEAGWAREAVHGPDCERQARMRNRGVR